MKKELIKKDYYRAVNSSWLEKAVIPGDQPQMSAFLELHLGIEKLLMELAKKWNKDQTGLDKNLLNFVKLYKMSNDFETREKLGFEPTKPFIEKINKLTSLKDLTKNFKELHLESINMPFGFFVVPDFMNSNTQVLYFSESDLFLPDKSYYEKEETKQQLLGAFMMATSQVLKLYGLGEEESGKLLNEAIALDALLANISKTNVEKADYVKMYNPYTEKELKEKIKTCDLFKIGSNLVGEKIEKLVVINPKFIDAFDSIINEENFGLIKSWMLIKAYLSYAPLLTEDLRVASGAFMRMLSGTQEAQAKEKAAFYHAYNRLSQAVGLYYGKEYFGPKAKKDVEEMVKEIIAIYRERITNNTWLQKATKEKAIVKLNHISVHVGYPEVLPRYYKLYDVSSYKEGSNLVLETIKFSRLTKQDNLNEYNKAPDKRIWGMPASMVNAYYSPFNNQIVFPAAILQKPYYSLSQSASENYGGIGAVMAHEISHAFDNSGAKFDEFGSLANWWTDEDLKAFEERGKEMIKLFDGVPTEFGSCNGALTVSENIADSGGLRCALEASKKHKDHNYEKFFQNWARVWRMKPQPQYAQLLLTIDVHGPAELRANMQLRNLVEFQEFYELKEEDPMFLKKEDMVEIW